MKYYSIKGNFFQEQFEGGFIMRKNRPLALEILKEQVNRKRFWRAAFIVAFAVIVIDRIVVKGR